MTRWPMLSAVHHGLPDPAMTNRGVLIGLSHFWQLRAEAPLPTRNIAKAPSGGYKIDVSLSQKVYHKGPAAMVNVHAKQWPWPTAPDLPRREVDPIVLQIVEGTLNSIEAEIEYAIERTARSPMIREAHDYRVGLFDRYCRKLTGRSYSAMPNAVVRDFPPQTMRPGDVFLMNDTYLTEGSIGHLPDLCSTVPVFHQGEVVAYIQAFGHHDDIGGRVPGSMPGTATTVF